MPYVPDRFSEGYGLNIPAIERLNASGATLLVTADCGTSSIEEVRCAREIGMDVIILDHHTVPPVLPDANALVNPKLTDASPGGLLELATAGLAFHVASALHEVGYVLTTVHPDYVVLGDTTNYNFDQLTLAIRLVAVGARFIATNPDPNGPGEGGLVPACGSMAALIEKATGVRPYFVGKPNPLMMRRALKYLGAHSENTIMVGDRMDTDIIAGMEAGLHTVLVMTGISDPSVVETYPFRPDEMLEGVHQLVESQPVESELDEPHADV